MSTEESLRLDPNRAVLVIQDPAERRHDRGGARRVGRAAARERAERGGEREGPGGGVPASRRTRDPRLVHRRGGGAGAEGERTALRGRQGLERARSRHVGCRTGRGPGAAGGRLRRREDAHERLGGHTARAAPARTRPRHGHRHGGLDEHVRRAHGPDGRRQGLRHDRGRGLLLDHERRLAQRVHQLRAPERLPGDELVGGDERPSAWGAKATAPR